MRISDWSSDVCSSDLRLALLATLCRTLLLQTLTEVLLRNFAIADLGDPGLGARREIVVDPKKSERNDQYSDGEPSEPAGGGCFAQFLKNDWHPLPIWMGLQGLPARSQKKTKTHRGAL